MVLLTNSEKKQAIVIGINYRGTTAQLNGCINDAYSIAAFLKNKVGYADSEIILLTDDTAVKPTKQNIIDTLNSVVNRAINGQVDNIWFSYSGHGSYTIDLDGDEKHTTGDSQEMDECLVPLDYGTSGLIIDDDLHNILIKRLPSTCTMVSLIDACHSGTALDLPFVYRCENLGVVENHGTYFDGIAKIVKISGCRDSQTSADANINGKSQGALTFCFLKMLEYYNYNITCRQLARRLKTYINENGYTQIPTLALSRELYLDELFFGTHITDANVTITLNGDNWCVSETTWNIYNVTQQKYIFPQNRFFSMKNEKLQLDIYIPNGRYILIFHDTYGNGVINGAIRNNKTNQIVLQYDFISGNQKTFEFLIDDKILDIRTKRIEISIETDIYSSESSWNIFRSDNVSMFISNRRFNYPYEKQTETLSLELGTYKLILRDTYGDGGLKGTVKCDGSLLLTFDWTNKNWSIVNGNIIEYAFVV